MSTAAATRLSELPPEKLDLLIRRLRREKERTPPAAAVIPRRVGGAEPVPLSSGQRRLWFLDRLLPGSPLYNVVAAARLEGALDAGALGRALSEVVRRHEALRTTFTAAGEEPAQLLHPPAATPLPLADLASLEPRRRAAESERLAREEARRPFDLTRGPLLRAALLRRGPADHLLVLVLHHIVCDGWSMEVLVRELAALYAAFAAGAPSALPELPIQYADFALWQRQWLAGEEVERQLGYWRRRLAAAPVLELPGDRPRPAARRHAGGRQPVPLAAPLAAALRQLGRREGTTLFMTLLAAFQALLARWSGQEDLCIGTPVSGRNWLELEGMIGFFVNTLVLRGDLAGDPTVAGLLARAREATLAAFAHQDLPFERLVEDLQPARDLAHTPLFQVMLVLREQPAVALRLPGLAVTLLPADGGGAKFDLTLAVSPADAASGSLPVEIEYDRDLFDGTTIARLAQHLAVLVAGMTADPGRRLSELPLLTPAERAETLVEWSGAGAAPAPRPGPALLHLQFEAQAARTPEAVAVLHAPAEGPAAALTYAALESRMNRLARRLRGLGVGPESRVGVALERTADLPVALLGVLKAGGAYVPLDPAYPCERLASTIDDAGAGQGSFVLLTQRRVLPRLQDLLERLGDTAVHVLCLDGEFQEDPDAEAALPPGVCVEPGNLAYLIYTSGSTGRPKGVAIEHRSASALLGWARAAFSPDELAGVFASTSINFDLSVFELFAPLAVGGCVVLGRDALDLAGSPAAGRVTLVNTVPSAAAELLRLGALPPSVRTVNLAGEPLRGALVERLYALPHVERVWNLYGPSEDTTYSTAAPAPRGGAEPTIGIPVAGGRAYVVDRWGQPAPPGTPGELLLGGEGLARGYLNHPELTAERFVPDPFAGRPGARLYHTGDLVRWLPRGELEFLGRLDHQVKVRGFRIELEEIETLLAAQPGVREAVVVVYGEGSERRLVAYVAPAVAGAGEELVSALRAALARRLPDYMVPGAFVLLPELPRTPSRKVDRKALPAPDTAVGEASHAPPRDPLEELLAGIWSDLLRRPRVGARDDFFALGGHSLLATQVISRVRDALGVELPLRKLFETPTVEGLARAVAAARRAAVGPDAPPIAPAPHDRPLPLSFAQQRLWFLDQLDPGNPAYNVPAAVRLAGALDVPALARSLGEVVRRHEALRTSFAAPGGEPLQVIAPWRPVAMPLADLTALPREAAERECVRLAAAEARRPFDLARAPLLRAALLRLGAAEHVVALTLHHIVSDGWSAGVLVRELAAIYGAFAARRPSPLPALPIQYADFACWQRSWLQGEPLERQVAYWRRSLGGALPELALPYDRPRRALRGYRGARHDFRVAPETAGRLRALCRQRGATLFMAALALLTALLGRLTGQRDVLVGTDVANRNRLETEGLIGFFVNILLLRVDLAGDPTFAELLARARETALGGYEHQDMPFDRLIEELQPRRGLSPTPLFQVLLVLQNAAAAPVGVPGLELAPLPLAGETSKFDLTLILEEAGEEIAGRWIYSTELFDAPTIERLARRFETLLQDAVGRPDARLSELRLPTDSERTKSAMENAGQPQTTGPRGVRAARRRPVGLDEVELVATSTLRPDEPLPLVIGPAVADVDLVDYARANLPRIEEGLARHGAILFRGFGLDTVERFERLAGAVCGELFGEYGDLPRDAMGGKVYSSTPYPADRAILFHNESSQMDQWPLKQWFFCVTPAQRGGETPIADCRRVYRLLDPALRERFRRLGVMYVRNFTDGLDVPWQEFFRTSDRAAVEETCRRAGIDLEWKGDDRLRTRKRAPAVAVHPKTGEEVFFNQIQAHHVSCLEPEVRASLLSLFGEADLPRNVLYGDGSPIEDAVMAEVRAAYEQVAVAFPWQRGDVLLVDNMLTAHSRNPYEGPRKIVVAMGEMIRNPQA
ncbi:MAG TPA: amino acid adenylation domain-containing protein [Thermoanaerobaculia bacterium]|nr:amino acid adenylation domain-containing protein [Thermoanaerobaculia bacterium]